MIPNGKEMNWKGHNLRFESEPDQCRGCFFADKDSCPDCDEGAWVEDSPWCIGTPTEEGWYFVTNGGNDSTSYDIGKWDGESFCYMKYLDSADVVAWQKKEPYKEKKDGIQNGL